MPELTQAQQDVLTDEEQSFYDENIPYVDKDPYADFNVGLCFSIAIGRIKNRAMKAMIEKIDTDHCGCLGKGQIIPELNALLDGE